MNRFEQPLAIDLYCGLGGFTEGLLAENYRVVGFDIERHVYGEQRYPAQLVVQDVTTLHGSQFKDAALIVASPPCTEYSYMAMPWKRAKQIARALRGEDEFPDGYKGSRTVADLNRLFDACFRIQKEASEAAGRHIPMIVENVKGAQAWVGRARWAYGSFYLWGDVPALMPITATRRMKYQSSAAPRMWSEREVPRLNDVHKEAIKNSGGSWFNIANNVTSGCGNNPRDLIASGIKQPGISGKRSNGKGDSWFQDGAARSGSKSNARKMASAMIAKIPLPLSQYIAAAYKPKIEND